MKHSPVLIIGWSIIIQAILGKYYAFIHSNELSGTNRFQMTIRRKSFAISHTLAQSAKLSKFIFTVTCVKNGQLKWINVNPLGLQTMANSN